MVQAHLLWILSYIWIAFGAYWMGVGLFSIRRADSASKDSTNQNVRRFRIALMAITFVLLFEGRHAIRPWLMILCGVAWAAVGLYWVIPGNAAQSGEFRFYRPLRLFILSVTFALLFWGRTGIGFFGERFAPETRASALAGFVLALCGIGLALWARIHLGQYWSDKVEIKIEHQLVRSGPYAYLRHPIYSGVLLGVAGTALLVGQWRGVLAFFILLVNYIIKAKREDEILSNTFADFADHRKNAGFLLPNFRRRI